MSSPAATSPPPPAADDGRATEAVAPAAEEEKVASNVDPFLVEALDNPRHRLVGESRAGCPRLSRLVRVRLWLVRGASADVMLAAYLGGIRGVPCLGFAPRMLCPWD
jgi:hypothetical protein